MTRRITAPILDDILARLTAEDIAELRARTPLDYADQLDAARSQSIGLMEHSQNTRAGWVPPNSVDEWIRLSALDALIGWIDGTARTCLHSPHWRRPEPVFAAAWRPHLVVCAGCLHLLGVTGVEDHTCDACGRVTDGVDADDPIYTGTVWIGALAYEFGTCTDCRPALPLGGVA